MELKEKIEKWKREKDKKINNEGGNKDNSEGWDARFREEEKEEIAAYVYRVCRG